MELRANNITTDPINTFDQLEDAMNKLLDKEFILDSILQETLAGYWDWHITEDYEFLSRSFKQTFGYNEDELPNKPSTWKKLIHPEDLERTLSEYEKHVKSKGVIPFNNKARYFHKDGSLIWINSRGRVIKWDSDGNPIRMIGCYVNITSQKKMEDELKKTQDDLIAQTERLKISTSTAKIGVWDWDVAENNLIWDQTMYEIYGIPENKFKGAFEAWKEVIHPDDKERCAAEVDMALKGEKDFNTEFRIIWPDGSIHYMRGVGYVKRDEFGIPLHMIGTNWDISADKEVEKQKIRARQLELKNRELEQFAYIASHDLQEPLRSVASLTELLQTECLDDLNEEGRKSLEFISEATARMSQLIKGLLDYSRIGRNHQAEQIDCNELVQSILSNLNASIDESNAEVKVGELPSLKAYKMELGLIFQNLISNAIKFRSTARPLRIKIEASQKNDFWEFDVSDNGIGLNKDHYQRIFLLFQRLHKRNEYQGTGIGLAHCQKIVDLHGGRIWVDSVENQGSKFFFTIPCKL